MVWEWMFFVLFCFRKLTSLSFKEGVFEILPHDSFLRHIFLKCYTFLTQKRSTLCKSLAALDDSRSLLRNLSDALMPWDAGWFSRYSPSRPKAWLCWEPWLALTYATLSVSLPAVQAMAPYLQPPTLLLSRYFFLPLLFLSSLFLGLASGEFGFVIRTSVCKLAKLLLSFG